MLGNKILEEIKNSKFSWLLDSYDCESDIFEIWEEIQDNISKGNTFVYKEFSDNDYRIHDGIYLNNGGCLNNFRDYGYQISANNYGVSDMGSSYLLNNVDLDIFTDTFYVREICSYIAMRRGSVDTNKLTEQDKNWLNQMLKGDALPDFRHAKGKKLKYIPRDVDIEESVFKLSIKNGDTVIHNKHRDEHVNITKLMHNISDFCDNSGVYKNRYIYPVIFEIAWSYSDSEHWKDAERFSEKVSEFLYSCLDFE